MALVPGTHTFTDGIATPQEANAYIRDPIAFLLAPPICKMRQTVAQTLVTATFTAITFDVEDFDVNVGGLAQHDNVTNNTRFTCQYAGYYELLGAVGFVANATGIRQAIWAVNGSLIADYFTSSIAHGTNNQVVAARGQMVYLSVADIVELYGWQSSGGNLNTVVASGLQSSMIVQWRSN